jgi:hydrogenase/urease accessory protein HupE
MSIPLPQRPHALLLLLLLGILGAAQAHEVRPAYLRIQEVEGATYDVLWRVPALGEMRLALYVRLPEECATLGEVRSWQQNATRTERWRTSCPGGLTDRQISIDGLQSTLTDVLGRYERLDGTVQVVRMTPSQIAFTVSATENWFEVATSYLALGVEHILLGIDHLLFVLALLMIVADWRKLIATITAFTVSHSVTLAAATLGWVNVPQSPVEAVIALSILFVAAEIVHWRQGRDSLTRRKPWIVAFTFGLLHGFGFAGALSDIGLPEHAIPMALLFFNVGVEVGQLLFVAAVYAVWMVLRRAPLPGWAWRVPVYGIGTMAAFWTIERIAGFAG